MLKKIMGILLALTVVATMFMGCGAGKYDLDPEKVLENGQVSIDAEKIVNDSSLEIVQQGESDYYEKDIKFLGKDGVVSYWFENQKIKSITYGFDESQLDDKSISTNIDILESVTEQMVSQYGEPTRISANFNGPLEETSEVLTKEQLLAASRENAYFHYVLHWDVVLLDMQILQDSSNEDLKSYTMFITHSA